ncbi:hypothetical protein CAEBREN_22403 [Caenorhabditis brenneri]|uniref:Uncharacterized protein n=1 Tax=Caenorhabditis brenneri TaxID=135651 RepID=G0NN57_CAEBE|nr:hypothetical protein CAEBREN_22403 [Caenorhabditis brenneri]
MLFSRYFFASALIVTVTAEGDLSTCARMDVPILDKVARGLCIASCSIQNCGTGDCQKRQGRPTCVCDRCANGGGSIPLPVLIRRGKGNK